MKNIILSLIIVLVTVLLPQTANAQTSEEKWNVASWEPGLGIVFRHQEKFSAARLQLGTRNLFIKNRVGLYYILEYRGGIQFQEDGTSFYFRDLLGLNYSINKSFSIHGGMGVFRKGILQSGEARGGEFYYNNNQFGRLRKEIGITYRIPQYPISVDICYSTWVGPTATFGYIIPMKQKKLGNAPLKSIPVYDVPVVVETKPEVVEQPKAIDTVVEQPIYVETKPEVVEPVVTQPVETVPEVDIAALAKQSTTYYPFNVDTLSQSNKDNLQALIAYVNEHPNAKITIFGNADRLGSESYNLNLSASRAKKVKEYLVSQGIQASRIKTVAYGELKAKGETEEERALNRCAEFGIQIQESTK
ncbi:MAG: OmpA family protein [Bacteroidetes bacterium]|nr:OmpA family protein [Bacteroidota bacterium]MDA1224083.1 OmpA family protein [Bacteroidota bacterium]